MSQTALDKLFAALERTGVEYANLHRVITAIFISNGCGADSEGLADVTLLDRLARRIDEGKEIRNFVAYSKRIATLVFMEYWKKRERFRNVIRDLEYLNKKVQEVEEAPNLRRKCQESCVGSLSSAEQQLLIDYYLSGKDRDTLTEELGLLIETLRSRIHRLRLRLEKCVSDCREKA